MPQFATLREIGRALAEGEYSSAELVQEHLDLVDELDGDVNSFITVDAEGALAQAREADALRAAGQGGPLTGLPIAHKDIFCTEGLLTTCGSHMLDNFVAPYDATVVTKLAARGCVTLGKTNMDEFAMGSSNETSHFGAVSNPWKPDRVPGGSSGGSAAAVAMGLTPAATGTDTGGSIRQPASFCGITGLKPTYGRVSRYGMIAFASSLDQGGPMCRDAEDVGLLLSAMAGFDPRDSTSTDRHDEWLEAIGERGVPSVESLKIGLPREYFAKAGTSSHFETLKSELEKLGHTFSDVTLPHTDAAIPTYYVIAGAEASTNLSRYDGVRFGHRCDNPQSLEDLYERSRSEGFGDEVKRRILTGTYALSVGYYDAYYVKAQKIRRLIANDFANAFTDVDVLLTPTTPGVAFEKGSLTKDPVAMYQQDLFTVPTSLAGLPAISFPCGQEGGLPLGAQLIAPAYREDRLLGLTAEYQHATDHHRRRAGES
jgi:aspartyl-tRNA(Asn)/glutamyl-tRNA(Gln) amidotransferase subunit A